MESNLTMLTEPDGGVIIQLSQAVPPRLARHGQHLSSIAPALLFTLVPRAIFHPCHAEVSVSLPALSARSLHHVLTPNHMPGAIHAAVPATRRADVDQDSVLILMSPSLAARERHASTPLGLVAELVGAGILSHHVAARHLPSRGCVPATRVEFRPAGVSTGLRSARVRCEENCPRRVPTNLIEAAGSVVVLLPAAVMTEVVRARTAAHWSARPHRVPVVAVLAAALEIRDEGPASGLADSQLTGV